MITLPYSVIFRDNGVEVNRRQVGSKSIAVKLALHLSGLPTFGPSATLLEAGERVALDDRETVEVSRT